MKKAMKKRTLQEKSLILSVLLAVIILCGTILFIASGESANIRSNELTYQDICRRESLELMEQLREQLCLLDQVEKADVHIDSLDDKINSVFLCIQVSDRFTDTGRDQITSYIQDYFEELEEGQIFITYVDSSFQAL